MKVLYFGSYDPNYSRNRILIEGLRLNGVEVLECRDNSPGLRKFFQLYKKYKPLRDKYDVMVVGFLGQQIVPFARLLTRKPIIFDAFLSLYDSNVWDRKTVNPTSFRALYYWLLDWISMKLADVVLFDTNQHINYVSNEFGIKKDKFRRIFVGTDDSIFYPRERASNNVFVVHFHGSFIPLQGVDFILRAAKLLENEKVKFNILGRGQTYSDNKKIASELGLKNVDFIESVKYDKLPEYINIGDVCLGIFGKTSKAFRVIPNKIYEYSAMQKAIITLDTPAIRELFEGDDLVLIKNSKPEYLASSIVELKNNVDFRMKLAKNAKGKVLKLATPRLLGEELRQIIKQL